MKKISALAPDLILVNSYSMLLHAEILSIPRFGCINIHAALLPRYRGSNPLQWVIINNETVTGVTMHYMTVEFDAGDIITQRRVPIYFADTWLDLQTRTAQITEAMLQEEMPKVLSRTNNRRPQSENRASYSRRRHPKDGLIDWEQSVRSTYNLIRALVKPLPGAFYYSGTIKVSLDQYMFVPEVASLKYGAGNQELRSGNVALLPVARSSLSILLDWLGGNERSPFSRFNLPAEAPLQEEWLETISRRNDVVVFDVRLCESNELIGSCWLTNIDYAEGCAESYVWINDAVSRAEKFESETLRLLLSFAFDDLSLDDIQLPKANHEFAGAKVSKKMFLIGSPACKVAHADSKWTDSHPPPDSQEEHAAE